MNSVVKLLVFVAALHAVRCGNINTKNCPITGGCIACMSSRTPELERCIQLQALISLTVSWNCYLAASHVATYRIISFCLCISLGCRDKKERKWNILLSFQTMTYVLTYFVDS